MNSMKIRLLPLFVTILGFGLLVLAPSALPKPSALVPQVQAQAQACPVPDQVSSVLVEFPSCNGAQCSFVNASCSWGAVANASSYNLTVTEVESGKVVKSESEPTATTKVTFPVTQGKTYKCDVAAVNSCGNTGATGTFSLLCQVQGGGTIAPTPTPPAKLPKTGSAETTLLLAFGGLGFMLAGTALYFYLKLADTNK